MKKDRGNLIWFRQSRALLLNPEFERRSPTSRSRREKWGILMLGVGEVGHQRLVDRTFLSDKELWTESSEFPTLRKSRRAAT
jgi:hypothetical protein